MARAASDITSARETEAQAAELAALLRLLDISAGTSSLNIAVCNSPALRDYLIGRVRESRSDLVVVALPRGCVDIYGEVVNMLTGTKPGAVFVTCIEHSLSSESKEHPTLKSLNASRDLWESRFPCPVVFWVPAYVAALLPVHAPDLWRYRSHGFEFVAPAWEPTRVLNGVLQSNLVLAGNLDVDQKRFRIAELEQRIGDFGFPPPEGFIPYAIVWMQELGFLYGRTGRLRESADTIARAISLCKDARFLGAKETLLGDLGNIASWSGDLERAESCYREALEISRQVGHIAGQAIYLGNLGVLSKKRGDLDAAEALYREALALDERVGRQNGQSIQLGNLGNIAAARGDLDDAEDYYRSALELERSMGRLEGEATQLGNIGLVHLQRGNQNEAEHFLADALEIQRRLGWSEGQAARLAHLASIKLNRGDFDGGERLLRQSLEIDQQLGNVEGEAQRLADLGNIAYRRGDHGEARRYWSAAYELYLRLGIVERVDDLRRMLETLQSE